MPLPLLLVPAAVAGVKTLYTALNKPKLREPKFMIEALDKQIANNSADIVNKTLMNVGTSAAKSAGARLYQQQERGIGQMAERGQLSEGQEAQALLEAGSNVQGVVGEQSQNLLMPQIDRNLQMKQQNDQARLGIAQMKDEARMRLQQERQQWKNELAGGIIDTATSAFSGIMQNIQDKKITEMVDGMLNGRNLPDLSDSELNGLMTSLYLAKLGIMPNQSTPTLTADNALLNKGKTPTVRDEVRTQLDELKKAGDTAEGLLIKMRGAANASPALTPPAEAATPAATQTGTGKSYAEWQNLVNGGDMSAATINMRNIESFKERGFWINARGQRVTTVPPGYSDVYGGQ